MTTKINHSEILNSLKVELEKQTTERNKAREVWLNNDSKPRGRDLYDNYRKISDNVERLEHEIKFHTIMLQDKKYATEWLYSDAHAYEIIEEKSANTILVRQLKATIKPEAQKKLQESFVPGGFCGHFDNDLQEWNFETCETNPIETIRKHKDGFWYGCGRRFTICAEPYEHYDYNF